MAICWKCHKPLELPQGPLSFRALCPQCDSWQHACVNCRHYKPGAPNDCAVPNTDPIGDREAANFCEDFSVKEEGTSPPGSGDALDKLFGEKKNPSAPTSPKNRFDSLWK